MKYLFLSLALASLTAISGATEVVFVNNTGHRVTVEPVYNQLVLGKKGTGVSKVISTGQHLIYQDVNLDNIDSYSIYYTTGFKSYLSSVTLSGREIAQRAVQANAPRVTVTLEAAGITGTGISYKIDATRGPQTGATQPVKLEESFIGIGMEDPLEIQRLYETIDKNPDDPTHVLLSMEQPPAQKALPNVPLAHQSYAIREYFSRLQQYYDQLKKYYENNRLELDRYYQEYFNITDYTDKVLELYKKAYNQLTDQLGLYL